MPFYPKKKGEEVKELLALALEHYEKETADLRLKVDSNVKPYRKLAELPALSDYKIGELSLGNSSHWFGVITYGGWTSTDPLQTTEAVKERGVKLSTLLDRYEADCKQIIADNEILAQENIALMEKIKAIMEAAGIPNHYYAEEKKTPRSSAKTVKKNAGYIDDLNRLVKTSTYVRVNIADLRKTLQSKYEDALRKAKLVETEKERKYNERMNTHELALLRAKYTPADPHTEPEQIMEALLAKNKYLHMAYWLEKQRGDWSDGFWQAEIALKAFVPESELDNAILENIQSIYDNSMEDGDLDGRVFRDCEYNYSVLYDMVSKSDSQLMDDMLKLNKIIEQR